LRLQFQPILDVETNRIVSCEALVRWAHPERGMLAPDVFIPIAERTGLIHEIGEWIMQEACRVLARLPDDVHMAVNISAAQLRGQSVLSTLAAALEGTDITNDRIDIEVTESLLIAQDDPAIFVINSLADAGFSITLDDFGTGYASLNYLNRMPLKRVKIDRQFTNAMMTEPRQAAIVNAILQLSKSLGLEVTAEGVETIAQLDLLRSIGCDAVQGYLIARPLSEGNLLEMFARRRSALAAA
jgi:diguanylate cyclase